MTIEITPNHTDCNSAYLPSISRLTISTCIELFMRVPWVFYFLWIEKTFCDWASTPRNTVLDRLYCVLCFGLGVFAPARSRAQSPIFRIAKFARGVVKNKGHHNNEHGACQGWGQQKFPARMRCHHDDGIGASWGMHDTGAKR